MHPIFFHSYIIFNIYNDNTYHTEGLRSTIKCSLFLLLMWVVHGDILLQSTVTMTFEDRMEKVIESENDEILLSDVDDDIF